MAWPTGRGVPSAGFRCISRPGPALTSTTAPPCSCSGLRDVFGHQVDAGDVQPDDARGQRHQVGHFRVHVVGAVDGDVAVALDQHAAAGGGHAVGREPLALQVGAHHVVFVDVDAVEREVLGGAAARVGVDLGVDQLGAPCDGRRR